MCDPFLFVSWNDPFLPDRGALSDTVEEVARGEDGALSLARTYLANGWYATLPLLIPACALALACCPLRVRLPPTYPIVICAAAVVASGIFAFDSVSAARSVVCSSAEPVREAEDAVRGLNACGDSGVDAQILEDVHGVLEEANVSLVYSAALVGAQVATLVAVLAGGTRVGCLVPACILVVATASCLSLLASLLASQLVATAHRLEADPHALLGGDLCENVTLGGALVLNPCDTIADCNGDASLVSTLLKRVEIEDILEAFGVESNFSKGQLDLIADTVRDDAFFDVAALLESEAETIPSQLLVDFSHQYSAAFVSQFANETERDAVSAAISTATSALSERDVVSQATFVGLFEEALPPSLEGRSIEDLFDIDSRLGGRRMEEEECGIASYAGIARRVPSCGVIGTIRADAGQASNSLFLYSLSSVACCLAALLAHHARRTAKKDPPLRV